MLDEMKMYQNWVAFRLEDRNGKLSKVPYNPRTGYGAKANDPATWADYQTAKSFNGDGVGFEFSESPFAGIDLDHCIDDSGNLTAWAADIVGIMDSYTEISPSGHGLHIFFKGEILNELVKQGKQGAKVGNIELYYGARYFTVTENPYGEVKPIQERTEQASEVYRKYLAKTQSSTVLDDSQVLEVMFHSKDGEKLRRLYSGDTSDYNGDDSVADLALCRELAFYTRKDATQIDRLFRGSGLMREKWDRPTAGSTYGAITIDKAIASTHDVYELKQGQERTQEQENTETDLESESCFNRLDTFFETVKKNREGVAIPTGFDNLDGVLDGGFYPGLYTVGANSSIGKTTFLIQVADFIAQSGRAVLYCSLEMSANELIAKSLSRLSFINAGGKNGAKTTRGILTGHYNEAEQKNVARATQQYQAYARNVYISEGVGDIKVETLKRKIDTFTKIHGIPPVLMIDYLQILAPFNLKMTDKQNTDKNVTELKRLSRDYGLPVIGISSFNRESYREPVSMASFKESGAIEYSSDVLIALQYDGWNYVEDEKPNVRLMRLRGLSKRLDMAAKNGESQRIQGKILKNRNGYRHDIYFDFFPMFNLFRSVDYHE